MSRYDLPNPFMQVSVLAGPGGTDREAAALEPDEPPFRGGAAAEPVGYQCCEDCGYTEQPCDEHCPNFVEDRFELDPSAFMAEIEPVPAFLTRPGDEYIPVSAQQADQIEEMLKLARAEEWPAPPRRMRA